MATSSLAVSTVLVVLFIIAQIATSILYTMIAFMTGHAHARYNLAVIFTSSVHIPTVYTVHMYAQVASHLHPVVLSESSLIVCTP